MSCCRERNSKTPRSFALPTRWPAVLATLLPANRADVRRIPLKPMYNCTGQSHVTNKPKERTCTLTRSLDPSSRTVSAPTIDRHRSLPTITALACSNRSCANFRAIFNRQRNGWPSRCIALSFLPLSANTAAQTRSREREHRVKLAN